MEAIFIATLELIPRLTDELLLINNSMSSSSSLSFSSAIAVTTTSVLSVPDLIVTVLGVRL